jgi:Tol biopolymer transport system component
VLFEMLTGRPAFQEEDVTEILASVVKASISLDLLPANIHPRVREIIARCLQKDLRKRYRDIGDVQYEIEQVLADPGGVLAQPGMPANARKAPVRRILWIAAAVVLTAVMAGVTGWNLKTSEKRQVSRFYQEITENQRFGDLQERGFAISPDGTQLVYKTERGLYLRSIADWDARLIAGTENNPQKPFFSPDGQWLGYVTGSQGQLKKISINGGAPVSVASIGSAGLLNWGSDDSIVYCDGGSIMKVSANGGNPEALVEDVGQSCYAPQILPDGKAVIYTIGSAPYKIMLQSLESGECRELFVGDTAQYLPTGHIVYVVDNSLYARPFDVDRLEVTGGPVSMLEGILRSGGAPQYAVSDSGTLAYISGEGTFAASDLTLVWVDRNGKEKPIATPANQYNNFRISPDGTRAALSVTEGANEDIWIWDFARETLDPLTRNEGEDGYPVWSPDGKRIAFHTHQKDAGGSVYWKAADGTGTEEAVGSFPGQEIFPWSWSGDGKTLAVRTGYLGTVLDIGALSMDSDHAYTPLLQESYAEVHPRISPDSRWLAYTSDESGESQIYVRPFPDVEKGRKRISTNGGYDPLWSPDGRELFYRNGDEVWAVSVETDPYFNAGIPEVLFRGTYYSSWIHTSWDIDPDGKRFLMLKPYGRTDEESTARLPIKINIVLNWQEELKQRVPVE